MMFCLFLNFQDVKDDISKLGPEGFGARAPCKGTLSEVVYQLPADYMQGWVIAVHPASAN